MPNCFRGTLDDIRGCRVKITSDFEDIQEGSCGVLTGKAIAGTSAVVRSGSIWGFVILEVDFGQGRVREVGNGFLKGA